MTEFNFEEFATKYVEAIKSGDNDALAELPKQFENDADRLTALKAVAETVSEQDDDFKSENEKVIGLITEMIKILEAAPTVAEESEDSSDSATEETTAEASEPATQE